MAINSTGPMPVTNREPHHNYPDPPIRPMPTSPPAMPKFPGKSPDTGHTTKPVTTKDQPGKYIGVTNTPSKNPMPKTPPDKSSHIGRKPSAPISHVNNTWNYRNQE